MTSKLDRLARENGISLTRPSPDNREVAISDDTKREILAALDVGIAAENTKVKQRSKPVAKPTNTVVPQSFLPQFLENTRIWGVSLQLYELLSARNWGIGDFEDLARVTDLVASLGGDFIGLNPLHAPFLADPDRCSPYEPSSRQYLNPLYIAVDRIPGFKTDEQLERQLKALRATDLVDYMSVAQVKLTCLRRLWTGWDTSEKTDHSYSPSEFHAYVDQGGEGLRRHALFETISSSMCSRGMGAGWRQWPEEFRRPDTPAVANFAGQHGDDIQFHMWLQWLAHCQLTEASSRARRAGLRIGLYLDLAVGEAIDGSATWSARDIYIASATIGSPPDPFAPDGQDWHLAAFHPSELARGDDTPFERMLSAAMRYAGAIRIDHAAALRRLFLVPLTGGPDGGAYVDYPLDDLLQILAQSSTRYRCLVIGEDLGMLPEGFQNTLADARILSYRILSYEREGEEFKPAEAYPDLALACISTHDHQTLAGWWKGSDIDLRAEHGIVPAEMTEKHRQERNGERQALLDALPEALAGISAPLPADTHPDALTDLVTRAHRFVARTPSLLVAVRLAELTDEKQPTNIPGTRDSYPNWKPKLSIPIEELNKVALLIAVARTMREERPAGHGAQ